LTPPVNPSSASSFTDLQEALGCRFRDPTLLRTALTHPSLAYDAGTRIEHNQRLEFLGDAVLELVVTHELFRRFPALDEGRLTKARAQLVNRRTLAEQSRRLGLGEHLQLSHGEEQSGGRNKQSALADAFEAVVGAIFLDGGYETARALVMRCFEETLAELGEVPSLDNPKGELQELLQTGAAEPPRYEITAITGPDHDREFQCVVSHRNRPLGSGLGKCKKAA